jgi:uncharacterized protein (TIGR02996 family)
MEAAFLQALHADPNDEATWLALGDWLEDDGQADRAELVADFLLAARWGGPLQQPQRPGRRRPS